MQPLKIIIITHLCDDFLRKCIHSIETSTITAEIIVLVSNDKELPAPSNIRTHQFRENIGYARAVNFAFQNYGSSPLLILNDDVVLQQDCLEKLWASYSPRQILQPEIRFYDHPQNIENTGHKLRLDGSNEAHSRGKKNFCSKNTSRLCFSGAAFLISPEIIRAVGLFDPDLSPFGEDLDYSLRSIRQGFSINVVSEALMFHKLGHSFGRYSLEKIISVESHRIQARFRSYPLFLAPLAPISTLYRYWQSRKHPLVPETRRKEAFWGTLKGITRGYTKIPRALRKRQTDHRKLSDWEFFELLWRQL